MNRHDMKSRFCAHIDPVCSVFAEGSVPAGEKTEQRGQTKAAHLLEDPGRKEIFNFTSTSPVSRDAHRGLFLKLIAFNLGDERWCEVRLDCGEALPDHALLPAGPL